MKDGSLPTSIGTVKSADTKTQSSRGSFAAVPAAATFPLSLSMHISGLSALETYSVFCYAETASGTGDSLEAVLATITPATTACCKPITFTNSPAYVYSDVTKYSSSSSSLFVFKYQLSSAPVGSLIVTPQFFIGGVRSTDIVATPSFFAFSDSSPLIAEYFISAPSTLSGNCTVSLDLSGSAGSDYFSAAFSMELLSVNSPIPPPTIASCQFSDSGQTAIISFDSPTDGAGIDMPSWPCSSLFDFVGANATQCTWLDSKTVQIASSPLEGEIETGPLLLVGNIVRLMAGKIKAFCAGSGPSCELNPAAAASQTKTLPPVNPLAPTVIVTTPNVLGACSDLSVDGTESYGNGGRMYAALSWNVSATTSDRSAHVNTSALQRYLTAQSALHQVRRPILVPRSTLSEGVYKITLHLTNFLGLSSFKTVLITVTGERDLPILTILGASYRSQLASSSLTVLATAVLSSCSSSTSSIKFKWAISEADQSVDIYSSSRDPSRFLLAPYTLQADKTYTVTVTATVGASSAVSSVIVYVGHGPVTAAIVGGYERSVPLDKPLLLDGSVSFDSDDETAILSHKVSHSA
jgi:REJ domain